jgi:hypothetical protein
MLKAKTLILCLLTFAFFHDRGIASTKTLDYRVGVCTHFGLSGPYLPNWNIETLIPKVADLGAGWIRDELYWNHYEREKGVYELPARTRAWIDAANAAGIKVLLIFNGSSKLYADSYDAKAYAAAAANLARELKGKVGCIEILNEPHNFGFSKYHGGEWNGVEKDGSVSPWIGKYVAFLNTAAQAIKSANPEMKVIGLGSVPPSNYRMLEMGIVPQVDGLVDHPYSMQLTAEILPWADTPGQLKRDGFVTADQRGTFASLIRLYRAASGRYSGPREIWLTEWGFTSYQQTKPDLFAGFTEEAQAKYLQRRLVETLSLGVEYSFIYSLKNDGSLRNNAEHNFGLLNMDNSAKPGFAAVRRVLDFLRSSSRMDTAPEINVLLENARPDEWPVTWDGAKLAAPGSIETHAFIDAEKRPVLVFWSSERAGGDLQPRVADIRIYADWAKSDTVRAQDLWTGETFDLPVKRQGGRVFLKGVTVPDHPIGIVFR